MKLGIFGGTFDPPHTGHLIVAQDACTALGLDRLVFMPAAVPPHKRGRTISDPAHRLAMLRIAAGDDARFEVSDLEIGRDGPSYTVDTLRQLHADRPDASLHFIAGADQIRDMHTWREPAGIGRLAEVVALSRAGDVVDATSLPFAVRALPVTRVDISSTEIRRRVAAAESIRYLVPRGVERYIRAYGLYR